MTFNIHNRNYTQNSLILLDVALGVEAIARKAKRHVFMRV
jgi:hypothetical protein